MKLTTRPIELRIDGSELQLRRTTGGVVEIWGKDDVDLAKGIGFAHAHDRLAQMMLTRLAGQGRLSECLRSDDETLAIDVFMRQMGFARTADAEAETCTPRAQQTGAAYCDGVNHYLNNYGPPWELKLARYQPQPWRTADTLLTIKLMSYMGLAQTQQDLEKFIIQAIRRGVDVARLKQLFHPHLDALDEGLCELIGKVKLFDPLIPHLTKLAPVLSASNNWAVAPGRSASGHPLQCNDPHLECNRLPALWYEFVMHTDGDYRIGVNMPGVPGMAMGRTRRVSFGFTYGFMDMVDYFIEEVRDGRFRRGDEYLPFTTREEVIQRKSGPPVRTTLYENETGVLESDPHADRLEDGLYLNRAYAGHTAGAAESLDALASASSAGSVEDTQQIVRHVSVSANWVIADRDGHIGYQQSGRAPIRRHSGLFPLPAWDRECGWNGMVPPDQFSTLTDPNEGCVVTANDDWNQPGKPANINISMGSDRADRIRELLAECDQSSVADMQRIQTDLLSLQAGRYMQLLRPLLPDTPAGRILKDWDLCYNADSRGATLFEAFYAEVLREVFGTQLFGADLWDALMGETALITTYFHLFDRILLDENDEQWFGEEGRTQLFAQVAREVTSAPLEDVKTWGQERQVIMSNIMLDGALPQTLARWLGIHRGPIVLQGCRATVVQGAIYRSHGRLSTFVPSYRFVTDLGADESQTALAGGPSGRVWSKWYATDVERWLDFGYKTLSAENQLSSDEE